MSLRPNILLFMVDEQRYPTTYDAPNLRQWMAENLKAQSILRARGVEFHRHYVQSAACAPSRTSIFTGQYPTLHGVSQTDGMGKTAFDPGMAWLDPDTVPTLGDWFRAGGYQTHYRGKWHISHADILVPGTKESLLTTNDDGTPIPENIELYRAADRLDGFGFSGWIGPEPHGADEANSGWVRDPQYRNEALELLDTLENGRDERPWFIVNSFVNPHDIVFYGLVWSDLFGLPYPPPPPEDVPSIPPPPTANEDLSTKPRAQASYVEQYGKMFLPQDPDEMYRRFYYFLQARVDQYILEVYRRLVQSPSLFENTIVVFTSDHGDLLGAHGGMHQKWYNAYEETIHVPLIFSGPRITGAPRSENALTSHADLAPTLLGLAGVDVERAARVLERSHYDTRPFVGRDLSAAVLGKSPIEPEPVFFMTYDNVSQGLSQVTGFGNPWTAVETPNQVQTIVAELDGVLWKFTKYAQDLPTPYAGQITNLRLRKDIHDKQDVPPEFEMYDLSSDPLETKNLANGVHETERSREVRPRLEQMLEEQRALKCHEPRARQGGQRAGGEGLVEGVLALRA